jgi:4-amino-4-deoxy-L-arabinose transferase-like glycosyltransferase
VLLAAAAVSALILTGFDGLYGQDSFTYFHYATGPLRQNIAHLQALPSFFWPPGYPLLVAAASSVIGAVPAAGQIVSLAAGAAVPILTFALAKEIDAQRPRNRTGVEWASVPLVAALIVAVTGQLLQSSLVVMADTLGIAAATAGAWALLRYRSTGAARWLIIAAAAFDWAIITRWIYALVAIPFALWALTLVARRTPRVALLHMTGAVAVSIIILGPILVPAVTGIARGQAPFAGDLQVYRWNPASAWQREFTTGDGALSYSLPTGLYYALAPGAWWFFGPILGALIVPGLWAWLRRRTAPLVGLLVAWAVIVLLFHAGNPWQNPRFVLAALPPLAILAALGYAQIRSTGDDRIRRAGTVCLVAGLALAAIGGAVLVDRFIARKADDVATVHWTERLAPPKSQVLTFGLTATFRQYGSLDTIDLSEINASTMHQRLSDGRPTVVLVDLAGIEGQWKGQPPWTNYRALRDGPGMMALGTRGSYTLFAVRQGQP